MENLVIRISACRMKNAEYPAMGNQPEPWTKPSLKKQGSVEPCLIDHIFGQEQRHSGKHFPAFEMGFGFSILVISPIITTSAISAVPFLEDRTQE